ncbi:MAG: hypothetical protein P8P99_13120 [Maricaulis sp.]|jgi:hypothetical protein|nr:hypothetical protein [Maricaulis sp.]
MSDLSDGVKARLEELREGRESALNALRREHAKTGEICDAPESIAGVKFRFYANAVPVSQHVSEWQGRAVDDEQLSASDAKSKASK